VFLDPQVLPARVDSQALLVATVLTVFPAILVPEEVKVLLVVLVVLDYLELKDPLVTRVTKETVD
jgi:hypothetical protein